MKTSVTGLEHPAVWLCVIGGTLAILFLLDLVWWVSLPLVLAVVFYYLSQPFLEMLMRRGLSHDKALYLFLAMVSLAALFLIPLVLPWLTTQIYLLQDQLPGCLTRLEEMINSFLRDLESRHAWLANAHVAETISQKLMDIKENFIKENLSGVVKYFISWIPSLLLVPYLTFFILKDAGTCKRLVMRGVPNAFFEKVLLLFDRVDRQMKRYFRGLIALTVLDTVTLALGLWLLGLPFGLFGFRQAVFLGLLCAVFAWVPFAGSVLGCILVALISVAQAPDQLFYLSGTIGVPANRLLFLGSICLFLVVRMLDDFLYTPLTVGRSLSAHPLLTVLMIFAGGVIGGATGLLLAMPVLGVAMVLGEIFGQVWFDGRLRARYEHALQLRRRESSRDLFS